MQLNCPQCCTTHADVSAHIHCLALCPAFLTSIPKMDRTRSIAFRAVTGFHQRGLLSLSAISAGRKGRRSTPSLAFDHVDVNVIPFIARIAPAACCCSSTRGKAGWWLVRERGSIWSGAALKRHRCSANFAWLDRLGVLVERCNHSGTSCVTATH